MLVRNNKSVVIHGPYHSGKTTFLWEMETYLQDFDIHPVYISLSEVEYGVDKELVKRFYKMLSRRIFHERLNQQDFIDRLETTYAYDQRHLIQMK